MPESHRHVLDTIVASLVKLQHVDAIAAYGSTASRSWSAESDIDLVAITSEPAPVEPLHFYVEQIPVDLSMRNRQEWEGGTTHWLPPDGLAAIWDPHNLISTANPKTNSPSDAEHFRYALRHMLHKLRRWQREDPEIADLIVGAATHFITVSYFHARGMRFPGIDQAVPYYRSHDPEMLDCLLSAIKDRDHRYERLTRAVELALSQIGGIWSGGDVFVSGWSGTPTANT